MGGTLKNKIEKAISNSTYTYYKNTNLYFRDYIYGDRYYVTLADVIYRFLTVNALDWDFEYVILGNIDIDLLVNDLYLHYIKADKKCSENYASSSQRFQKNYIMIALRNATCPLLKKQFKQFEVIAQDIEELNSCKKLHYISIYSQDGRLLEDLSYNFWEKEKSKKDDIEIKTSQLAEIFKILDPLQRKVVYLVTKNKTYSDIANILQVEQDKVRKILYSATKKLKNEHNRKRLSA